MPVPLYFSPFCPHFTTSSVARLPRLQHVCAHVPKVTFCCAHFAVRSVINHSWRTRGGARATFPGPRPARSLTVGCKRDPGLHPLPVAASPALRVAGRRWRLSQMSCGEKRGHTRDESLVNRPTNKRSHSHSRRVFGLWEEAEEAGEPGEKPHRRRENMQNSTQESNPQPSCFKATAPTAAPPRCPTAVPKREIFFFCVNIKNKRRRKVPPESCVFPSTCRNEGAAGFYKGIIPNVIRVTPACCITFVVYENVSRLLLRQSQ